MAGSMKPLPQPVSLQERRRQQNQRLAQTLKPLEQRVTELEADLLRAIDLILDQEDRLEKQERYFQQLLRALQKEV